ncbi:Fur family transcriptional regulator, partial [Chloroflexota bacterium]
MSCALILKQKGMKLTPQRRLILEIIHQSRSHLTAEEIIAYVQSRVPGVNKSTIYRTLELLEELGCVFKSEIDG